MAITEYEDKIKDIVENLDKEEFIFEFLSVYSKIAKSTITKLRKGTNNLSKVPGEYHLKINYILNKFQEIHYKLLLTWLVKYLNKM